MIHLVTKVTVSLSMQAESGFVIGSAMKALIMLFAQTEAADAPYSSPCDAHGNSK
jgi:hypothetical protein